MANPDRRRGQLADVRTFMGKVFGADMHAKRIDSLAGATLGVMQSAFFAVAMIGQALALAKGLVTKRAIKQIDPMPKNNGIDVWDSQLARRQAAGGRRRWWRWTGDGRAFDDRAVALPVAERAIKRVTHHGSPLRAPGDLLAGSAPAILRDAHFRPNRPSGP